MDAYRYANVFQFTNSSVVIEIVVNVRVYGWEKAINLEKAHWYGGVDEIFAWISFYIDQSKFANSLNFQVTNVTVFEMYIYEKWLQMVVKKNIKCAHSGYLLSTI